MRPSLNWRLALPLFLVCLSVGVITAQQQPQSAPPAQSQPSAQQPQPPNPDTAVSQELSTESEKAVHAAEGHEEYSEFKYSNTVAKLGQMIGIDAHGMYWVSLFVNFAILALFFWMLLKSRLPQMFRDRTSAIQKALKEAHDASADASRRLADIETRLSKLDAEVTDIRAGAEKEAAAEEERIRASAEEDKHKVVEAAESEIAAIARSARHDLKSFAASLAVDIAAHKIKVDDNTDQALVRRFVDHLGKDGQ
jgi:F-type H+-transporting ATPase subunit b